jgi:hypothetical protein
MNAVNPERWGQPDAPPSAPSDLPAVDMWPVRERRPRVVANQSGSTGPRVIGALSDTEAIALSGAVQAGVAEIREMSACYSPAQFAEVLAYYRNDLVDACLRGTLGRVIRSLQIGQSIVMIRGLGAIALHPGGGRLFGILFCAEHAPAGVISSFDICTDCLGSDDALALGITTHKER